MSLKSRVRVSCGGQGRGSHPKASPCLPAESLCIPQYPQISPKIPQYPQISPNIPVHPLLIPAQSLRIPARGSWKDRAVGNLPCTSLKFLYFPLNLCSSLKISVFPWKSQYFLVFPSKSLYFSLNPRSSLKISVFPLKSQYFSVYSCIFLYFLVFPFNSQYFPLNPSIYFPVHPFAPSLPLTPLGVSRTSPGNSVLYPGCSPAASLGVSSSVLEVSSSISDIP